MFRRAGFVTVVVLTITGGAGAAAAEEPGGAMASPERVDRLSTLWDRDAVMLVWAPLAGTLAVNTYMPSRETPLMFSKGEGGEASLRHVEVPGVALTIGGGLVAGSFLLGDDPARFQHAKGLIESLAMSGFVAVSVKRLVGRQRPDYQADSPTEDGRRSFPSGHTTRALTTITYAALYLRYHGFDQWREPGTLPWWELSTYAGLGALAVGFGGERVIHNRHHLTDVLAGGALGAASSTLLFIYNERKYRAGKRAAEAAPADVELRPVFDDSSERVTLPAFDGPMMSFSGSF